MNIDPFKISELGESALLFIIILKYLKVVTQEEFENKELLYSKEFDRECTIADLDFKEVTSRYAFRTYRKHFNTLFEKQAIEKVNPENTRCHKYYVNTDYADTFNLNRY